MRKKQLCIFLIVLLIVSVFGALNISMLEVSAVEYPAIYIDPAETWNTGLTPGMNYSISIKTNYTGDDIWSYSFTLNYNPNVLHGGINYTDEWISPGGTPYWFTTYAPIVKYSEKVYLNDILQTRDVDYLVAYSFVIGGEIKGLLSFLKTTTDGDEVKMIYLYDGVVNGDLITEAVHPNATFQVGDFNNTLGTLDLTGAYFLSEAEPVPTTSGPGILANITFTVVGNGFSDITLGDETKLQGWTEGGYGQKYTIIDALTMFDHIQHGFFCNILPSHDVAVVSLDVPTSAAIEQPVPISVTVKNNGTYDESVNLTVYYDTNVIDTTTFPLEKGLNNTVSFSWDTSGLAETTYTINATATIALDDDLSDNNKTKSITLQLLHDVAVVSLDVPTSAAIEQPVPISVTVAERGLL